MSQTTKAPKEVARTDDIVRELIELGLHVRVIADFPHWESMGDSADRRMIRGTLEPVSNTYPLTRFVLPATERDRINESGFYPHLSEAKRVVFRIITRKSALRILRDEGSKDLVTKKDIAPNECVYLVADGQAWKLRFHASHLDEERPQGDVLLASVHAERI